MKKQEYQKPEMEVLTLQHQTQLMAGSLNSISASGLDSSETLNYDENSGNAWEDGWLSGGWGEFPPPAGCRCGRKALDELNESFG